MDMVKQRLGTPSNGSLHGTFTTYGSHLPSASTGPRSQAPTQRRPLRSISQNSSLSPSPGLLVSMLKTTTEMGDVRTFPMQSQQQQHHPVTPTAYHQLHRSRPDLVAATPSKYIPNKRAENYYCAEDVSRRTLTLVLQCWMMLLTGRIPSPPTALVAYRLTKDRQSYRVIPAEVNFRDHALHFHIQHGSRGQGSAQLLLRSLITDVSNTAG
ncbi:hypothetical protein E4U32_000788 [Claviceps aff. humidiphila group G2b]|nr:hypothetical protein E4U32_000788 [Claviceps aff. humidiphila group G2b]